MTAPGTVQNPKRVRFTTNERVDDVDADGLSSELLEHADAISRSQLMTPENVGGTVPVGLILTGFALTLNPTSGSDGKVRIQSPLGVAVDADGRRIIKEAGTQVDVVIPSGSQQLYAYWIENQSDPATRRFISASSPYAESPQTTNTRLTGSYGFWVRAGNATNIVTSDNVNGQTRALVLLGIVTNTAGVISCTGYDPVNAPNGTICTNRLSTIAPPTTPPTLDTISGSIQTLLDLISALGYTVGQTAWKGSNYLTPGAGNNYGAFNIPAGGIDAAYRKALGYVTIGNGTTQVGDFNTNQIPGTYANANALLTAAFNALPTQGGTIFIKSNTTLSGFGGSTITLPGVPVNIVGPDGTGNGPATFSFVSGEALQCGSSTIANIQGCNFNYANNAVLLAAAGLQKSCTISRCYFNNTNTSGTDGGAAIQNSTGSTTHLSCEQCVFQTALTSSSTNGLHIRLTGGAATNITLKNLKVSLSGVDHGSIQITDIRDNFMLDGFIGSDVSFTGSTAVALIYLDTSTNATQVSRIVKNIDYVTTKAYILAIGNCGYITVEDCLLGGSGTTNPSLCCLAAGTLTTNGAPVKLVNVNMFSFSLNGTFSDLRFDNCRILGAASNLIGATTSAHGKIEICDSKFIGAANVTTALTVNAAAATLIAFERNVVSTYNSSTIADWGVIRIKSSITSVNTNGVEVVNLIGNKIDSIQNGVNWTGSDTTHWPRIFECDGAITSIYCLDNTVASVGGQMTGSSTYGQAVYLLDLSSADRATSNGCIGSLVVADNVIGSRTPQLQDCSAMLVTVSSLVTNCQYVSVRNNFLQSVCIGLNTFGSPTDLIHMAQSNGSNPFSVSVDGNTFYLTGALLGPFPNVLFIAGSSLCCCSFLNNTMILPVNGTGWFDGTSGQPYGIGITNLNTFNCIGNMVCGGSGTGTPTTTFRTKATGTVTATNPSGGIPATGVAWTSNANVYGG